MSRIVGIDLGTTNSLVATVIVASGVSPDVKGWRPAARIGVGIKKAIESRMNINKYE
ncbi:MAG: hypothetical protein ABJC04_03290 [Verrucomicrobiota bacterium]